jgi:hypothetical protein
MTLSPNEAAETLRDIAAVETRSHRLYGYRQGSPHLILWGVLWAIGYGLTEPWPQQGREIWSTLVAIGLVGGFVIVLRSHARVANRTGAKPRIYWRFPAIALTGLAFIFAGIAVMGPVSGRQIGAFIPLVVAAGYAVMGFWLGLRFTIAGAVLATLTLAGFFLLPTHFSPWMAMVGGGTLILSGFWLRRA